MRASLDRLLRDITLITLALAIALGWALFQVAEAIAQLVAGLLYEIEGDNDSFFFPSRYTTVLVWDVGGRVLMLGPLVVGLIELGVVLVVGLFVYRRAARES